jgi:Domain of unknown function (DUF4262)
MNTLPQPVDAHDHKLLSDVENYGWHVVGVSSEDGSPGFAYSVGLYRTFNHPEIIVFGPKDEAMPRIINAVGEAVQKGSRFKDLDENDDALNGPVIFREVESQHYPQYLGFACWYYQGIKFPTLQCTYQDEGRYPWHPETSTHRPALYDNTAWHFGNGGNSAVATTMLVGGKKRPILEVVHTNEDMWCFLWAKATPKKDIVLAGMGHMVKMDPTINELAQLPRGWRASRSVVGSEWMTEPA